MAIQHTRPVVVWILVVGLVISGALATKVELDKRKLSAAYAQVQQTLEQLEQERAHLNQELAQARQAMEGQASDIAHLQEELGQLQERLAQNEQEVGRLKLQQAKLLKTNEGLSQQLAAVIQEKQLLETKLSSLKELKATIRAVKQKLWQQRWQGWLARVEAQQAADLEQLAQGNRGFVIRNGAPTLGLATKLQVRVLEPQTH